MIKKTLFVTILALYSVSVFAQKQQYSISGTIKGIQSDKVFLEQYIDNKFVKIDSSAIVDDKFSFKGEVNTGINSAAISVSKVRGYMTVFLEKGDIKINADIDKLYLAEIKGGENSEILSNFFRKSLELEDMSMEFLNKHQQMNRLKNRDSASFYLKKHIEYIEKVEINKKDFANDTKKSAGALYYYRAKLMSKVTDYNEIVNFINDYSVGFENNNDLFLIKNHASLLNTIKAGAQLVDITLPDKNGLEVKLSSFRGKYVLIDFWASWCAPCRNEAKHLVEVYKLYSDMNFEILGISIDNDKGHWEKAMDEDKTPWRHVLDRESKYKKLFGITSIPRLMLIDPEGKVISNMIRDKALTNKLKEIFNK